MRNRIRALIIGGVVAAGFAASTLVPSGAASAGPVRTDEAKLISVCLTIRPAPIFCIQI